MLASLAGEGKPLCVGRAPGDERCLLVSAPNKALSQSFENLIDENNLGLMTVRASLLMARLPSTAAPTRGITTTMTSQTSRAGSSIDW